MLLQLSELLTADECVKALKIAEDGSFTDGLETAPGSSHEFKKNQQLHQPPETAKELRNLLDTAINRSPIFKNFLQAKRISQPMLSRYTEGMFYGRHLDKPIMSLDGDLRTDLSITIFLSDPETYDGGALVLQTELGEFSSKLPMGGAIAYPTHYLHEVEKVTRGQRIALVAWVQSYVKDPVQRRMLYDLSLTSDELHEAAPQSEASIRLRTTLASLTKLWSEV